MSERSGVRPGPFDAGRPADPEAPAGRGLRPGSPGQPIISPANPRIRATASLRGRRERDRAGRTLVDGVREIERALDADVTLEAIFVCRELLRSEEGRSLIARFGPDDGRLVDVAPGAFSKLAFGERAEGVVAVAHTPSLDLDGLRLSDDPLIAVVEEVEKPGNLGAILRSADGAGLDGLIAADPRTDLFNPNVIRASLGTVFGMSLAVADPPAARDWLRERGIRIVAARVDGSSLYTEIDLTGPLAIVLGSEVDGLGPTWAAPDAEAVRLPMLGSADSLNVSAAAAILFYEARRQRDLVRGATPRARTTAGRVATTNHG